MEIPSFFIKYFHLNGYLLFTSVKEYVNIKIVEREQKTKKENDKMIGIEITVEAEKRTQGIPVREEKTYSLHFIGDTAKDIINKGLKVALNRLPEDAMIDIAIIKPNYTIETIIRVISRWGKIELRKAIGMTFEIQEEYERKGHWKKRMKDFIKEQLEQIEQPEQKQEVYWYEYIYRGFSPGCQPEGFIDKDNEKGRFGWIAYDRELTEQEINDYELRPVK